MQELGPIRRIIVHELVIIIVDLLTKRQKIEATPENKFGQTERERVIGKGKPQDERTNCQKDPVDVF